MIMEKLVLIAVLGLLTLGAFAVGLIVRYSKENDNSER